MYQRGEGSCRVERESKETSQEERFHGSVGRSATPAAGCVERTTEATKQTTASSINNEGEHCSPSLFMIVSDFFLFYFTGKIPKTDLVDNTFGYKKRDYPTRWDNLFSIW